MFKKGDIARAISIMGRPDAEVELLYYKGGVLSYFDNQTVVYVWRVLNLDDGKEYDVRTENLRKRHEPGDWETLNDEMGRPIWRPQLMECES